MKIFKFIGSTLSHVEALVDSVGTTVVTGSDTIGAYANHQLLIAEASGDIIVKTALLELDDEYEILLEKRAQRKAERAVKASKSTSDPLAGLV